MQRDVKVGLILGMLLVAVVAVVFYRKEDEDRDKFARLVPGPNAVADQAHGAIASSPTDPYHVAPEYVADRWQRPRRPRSAESSEPRAPAADPAHTESAPNPEPPRGPRVILQPPDFGPAPQRTSRAPHGTVKSISRAGRPDVSIRTVTAADGVQEYVIREGDTLSEIAGRELGQPDLYPMIYDANRDVLRDPESIPVGQKIRIPLLHRPTPAAPPTTPQRGDEPAQADPSHSTRTYEVQENDTLIRIARRFYHRDAMYVEILRANRDRLAAPEDLRPGMILVLP
jgi:nucleoid-associated protein YgaU